MMIKFRARLFVFVVVCCAMYPFMGHSLGLDLLTARLVTTLGNELNNSTEESKLSTERNAQESKEKEENEAQTEKARKERDAEIELCQRFVCKTSIIQQSADEAAEYLAGERMGPMLKLLFDTNLDSAHTEEELMNTVLRLAKKI